LTKVLCSTKKWTIRPSLRCFNRPPEKIASRLENECGTRRRAARAASAVGSVAEIMALAAKNQRVLIENVVISGINQPVE